MFTDVARIFTSFVFPYLHASPYTFSTYDMNATTVSFMIWMPQLFHFLHCFSYILLMFLNSLITLSLLVFLSNIFRYLNNFQPPVFIQMLDIEFPFPFTFTTLTLPNTDLHVSVLARFLECWWFYLTPIHSYRGGTQTSLTYIKVLQFSSFLNHFHTSLIFRVIFSLFHSHKPY